MLVLDDEDQADWFITATTEDGAAAAATELLECADLRTSLWSDDRRGAQVLLGLRRH